MPEKGPIGSVLIFRRLQEEYNADGKKLYMCFVDVKEACDRERKCLECVMKMNGIPEVFVRSVMSLYEGVRTRVTVDSELSEEFEV